MQVAERCRGALLGVAVALLVVGCNSDAIDGGPSRPDASTPSAPRDLSVLLVDEGPPDLVPELCSPDNPLRFHYGPPQRAFPLEADATPDPLERDIYLLRDADGYLVTPTLPADAFRYVWAANSSGNVPTVSKVDRNVREVARYLIYTCGSLPTGSTAACDGMSGCCALDDAARYAARKGQLPEPGHQAVAMNVSPGLVAIDWNGDALVATGIGLTLAVTRIATTLADCVDRNHNGRIDTSYDANKNGFIEVDCNGDGIPDDIASVKAKPCQQFMSQEYFGLDDECVLWTTNVLPDHDLVGALAVGPSRNLRLYSRGDVWVGSGRSGAFVRIDGTSGLAIDGAQLNAECLLDGNAPGGMVLDATGNAWVPSWKKGQLCWFDTENPSHTGAVRNPAWGPLRGGGIAIDPGNNIWLASRDGIARYAPDVANGLQGLSNGWWTRLTGLAGQGIDVDQRGAYFAWACDSGGQSAIEIPASTIPVVKMDRDVAPGNWPRIQMPCNNLFVDLEQNVWGVDRDVTRVKVDGNGGFTQPKVDWPPQGIDYCPRGDSCPLGDTGDGRPRPARTIDGPPGTYRVIVPGCHDSQGHALPTEWGLLSWDADVPPNTGLSITASTGHSSDWNAPSWHEAQRVDVPWPSPVCLAELVKPDPAPPGAGEVADAWLQLEVTFKYTSRSVTARLKSLDITYRCK